MDLLSGRRNASFGGLATGWGKGGASRTIPHRLRRLLIDAVARRRPARVAAQSVKASASARTRDMRLRVLHESVIIVLES
jgi:hypothetical protein